MIGFRNYVSWKASAKVWMIISENDFFSWYWVSTKCFLFKLSQRGNDFSINWFRVLSLDWVNMAKSYSFISEFLLAYAESMWQWFPLGESKKKNFPFYKLCDLAFFPRQLMHLLRVHQPQGSIEAINYAKLFHTQFFEK